MPCYKTVNAWQKPENKQPVFKPIDNADQIALPCGGCIGCRLEYARQWAVRCIHEAQLHKENSFVTLTYNDENLPENGSLNLTDIQKFIQDLRNTDKSKKIRFFQCGEYGEKLQRPHHHVLLFGRDFHDKKLWTQHEGNNQYRSEELEKLWTKGQSIIGNVTPQSASYVARYAVKKITGKYAQPHYLGRKPEYVTMSRRPGIGHDWIIKYNTDVYPHDHVIVNGKPQKPPRYYDKILKTSQKDLFESLKQSRINSIDKENSTDSRLAVRMEVKESRIKTLQRPMEKITNGN